MTAHRDANPMLPLARIWRVRVVFVVALSLLGAVLLAPGTTWASCGSYVTIGSSGKNAGHAAVVQTGLEQMPPANHSEKPRPCSGPHCSDRPSIPPLPAVPTVHPPGNEAWGLAAFTLVVETSSAPFAESLSSHQPLQPLHTIFHPPRFVANPFE